MLLPLAHLLRPLRGPADVAAARRSARSCPTCRRPPPGCSRATAWRRSTAVESATGKSWSGSSPNSAGKTLRFAIRRGPDAEERDVTPIDLERLGQLRAREHVGWIGVSPRFHLPEIGVLDPASPAAQAGLKTFDFVTAVGGVPVGTWTEFSNAIDHAGRVAAAAQLPARRLFRGAVRARRDPGARVGDRHPHRRVRRRRPSPLRDRHPLGRAVRLLRRAGQPRRPDRPAPR